MNSFWDDVFNYSRVTDEQKAEVEVMVAKAGDAELCIGEAMVETYGNGSISLAKNPLKRDWESHDAPVELSIEDLEKILAVAKIQKAKTEADRAEHKAKNQTACATRDLAKLITEDK